MQEREDHAEGIEPLAYPAGFPRNLGRTERDREATVGIEPTIGVLQTPALTTWPRRPVHRHDSEGSGAGQTEGTICAV